MKKVREVASVVVFLYVAFCFIAINHGNKVENERIVREVRAEYVAE
jgi:hypothetical protein